MTFLFAKTGSRRSVARPRVGAAILVAAMAACVGCQTLLPSALPGGGFALTEDARIAQKAKSDAFPSPADVGLTEPTSVP